VAQHIRDDIESAREHQRQVLENSEKKVQSAIDRIKNELAEEWSELASEISEDLREKCEEVEESQGRVEEEKIASAAGEESSDPTVSLMREWLSFVESVRRYAPKAKRRVRGNTLSLFSILALSEGHLERFATPSSWIQTRRCTANGDEWIWVTPETDSIRVLMEEMRDQHLGWQYQRRDF